MTSCIFFSSFLPTYYNEEKSNMVNNCQRFFFAVSRVKHFAVLSNKRYVTECSYGPPLRRLTRPPSFVWGGKLKGNWIIFSTPWWECFAPRENIALRISAGLQLSWPIRVTARNQRFWCSSRSSFQDSILLFKSALTLNVTVKSCGEFLCRWFTVQRLCSATRL